MTPHPPQNPQRTLKTLGALSIPLRRRDLIPPPLRAMQTATTSPSPDLSRFATSMEGLLPPCQASSRPPRYVRPRPSVKTLKSVRDATHYDARWARLSRATLKENPVCYCDRVKVWSQGKVITVALASAGTFRPAVLTDHIRPINQGGRMRDPANLQTLCRACHALKTARWG